MNTLLKAVAMATVLTAGTAGARTDDDMKGQDLKMTPDRPAMGSAAHKKPRPMARKPMPRNPATMPAADMPMGRATMPPADEKMGMGSDGKR